MAEEIRWREPQRSRRSHLSRSMRMTSLKAAKLWAVLWAITGGLYFIISMFSATKPSIHGIVAQVIWLGVAISIAIYGSLGVSFICAYFTSVDVILTDRSICLTSPSRLFPLSQVHRAEVRRDAQGWNTLVFQFENEEVQIGIGSIIDAESVEKILQTSAGCQKPS